MRGGGIVMVVPALLLMLASVALAQPSAISFVNVSKRMGLKGREFIGRKRPHLNKYWGACVFDANQDGLWELLLPNHQQRTEFYWGTPTGFKYQQTDTSLYGDVHGVGAADMDGDGDEDFIMSRGGLAGSLPATVRAFRTQARQRTFSKMSTRGLGINIPVRARSLAFFDVNGDGTRDLMMVNRHKKHYKKAHFIYRNHNGKFSPIMDVGFQETVAAWFCLLDVNRDGYLDVLLMGFKAMDLWMGTGKFKYKKENWRLSGFHKSGGARGCAEFDIDNDGQMEVYIVRGAEGNPMDDYLFKISNGRFEDISRKWRLPRMGSHVHVTYLDINNDGFMDAYISVTTWNKHPRRPDILLYNRGWYFQRVNIANTGLDRGVQPFEDGDNAVGFDFNNDGMVDLLVGSKYAPWRLYQNKTPSPGNNWVKVSVGRPRVGHFKSTWNKDPWGALVTVHCTSKMFTQRTGSPGMSHTASNILRLHFGVGKCNEIRYIRTVYIGGVTVVRPGGSVNTELQTGLKPCPLRNCGWVPPCSYGRCQTSRCERNSKLGHTFFCPID